MMFEESEVAVAIREWLWRKRTAHFVAYAPQTCEVKIQDDRCSLVVANHDRPWAADERMFGQTLGNRGNRSGHNDMSDAPAVPHGVARAGNRALRPPRGWV
ncbi:hypothetical protein [Paraburkholderia sp. 40]|uniref:hypothetical protein n=1 Tax=unclassified Paraburkholderia TaxID=2615204 RepID=UPI003D1D587B